MTTGAHVSPNVATWRRTAELFVLLDPGEMRRGVHMLRDFLLRDGYSPEFVVREIGCLLDRIEELLAAPTSGRVH